MPAHTGERAEKTGTFECRGCKETVRVRKGERLPECPCGGTTFVGRTHEPGSRTRKTKKGATGARAKRTRAKAGKTKNEQRRAA
jgi:hypothetical protein